MAALGTIGTAGPDLTGDWYFAAWYRYIVATVILPDLVGAYAAYGGYVYVK